MKKRVVKTSLILVGVFLLMSGCYGNKEGKEQQLPVASDLDGRYLLYDSQGKPITAPAQWEKKRKEIYAHFADHIYGRMPEGEVRVSFNVREVDARELKGQAVKKTVDMLFEREGVGRKVEIQVWLPVERKENGQPLAAFMGFGFLPCEKIVQAGYAAVVIMTGNVFPDGQREAMKNRQKESLLALWGIENDADMASNTGQMIANYAWAVSRTIDYLETDPDINDKELFLTGCSRAGKTAAWTLACEPRIAMGVICQSGAMGASLTNYTGADEEPLAHLAELFPHWFCPDFYANYMDEKNHSLYDQDALLALTAPRPLYLCSSVEYKWGDPTGEFLAARNVGGVYRLYGYEGINLDQVPAINAPVMNRVGYHTRIGGHLISDYDWEQIFIFTQKWFPAI